MMADLLIFPRPKWGAYCLHCRAYLDPGRLLPLKGRRKVAAPDTWELGMDVGRCPFHGARPVAFLAADDATAAEWHAARAGKGMADARP